MEDCTYQELSTPERGEDVHFYTGKQQQGASYKPSSDCCSAGNEETYDDSKSTMADYRDPSYLRQKAACSRPPRSDNNEGLFQNQTVKQDKPTFPSKKDKLIIVLGSLVIFCLGIGLGYAVGRINRTSGNDDSSSQETNTIVHDSPDTTTHLTTRVQHQTDQTTAMSINTLKPHSVSTRFNLAKKRPAFQKHTRNSSTVADKAVDGVVTNSFRSSKQMVCAHSSAPTDNWWTVDLQQFIFLHSVRILPLDGSGEQLAGLKVCLTRISPVIKAPNQMNSENCQEVTTVPTDVKNLTIIFNDFKLSEGRYVVLYLPGNSSLTLCEVEVFGIVTPLTGNNLAFGRPVQQSTTDSNSLGEERSAELAVDGNYDNSYRSATETYCSGTKAAGSPKWWAVDLGDMFNVFGIKITPRERYESRLSGLTVYVEGHRSPFSFPPSTSFSYPKCVQLTGSLCYNNLAEKVDERITLLCSASTPPGRYVILQLTSNNPLELCEVEVFGELAKK